MQDDPNVKLNTTQLNLTCIELGTAPPQLVFIYFQISLNENMTTSELQITPKYHDNGKNLTCRAENTKLVNNRRSAKESNINLNVLCELLKMSNTSIT